METPRRKPRQTGELEARADLCEGEPPCRTGLREGAGFLAWGTGHAGCFVALRHALRNQRLGSHRTCPQSQPRLRPPLSLIDSRSLQPGISALWGSDDPMAWFGDGSARGHASKWAGAQEGRQPLTTLGT